MSFVGVGGSASLRPTYFELLAAERLTPSLKSALVYSLSVFSQRHPWIHRLLDREDEVFAGLLLLLNAHSLSASSALYAESLYGMRRCGSAVGSSSTGPRRMSPTQLRGSLLASVLLPYLRAKLEALHKEAVAAAGDRVGGLQVVRYRAEQVDSASHSSTPPRRALPRRQQLLALLRWLYPWLQAGIEGAACGYQLLYLLGITDYYSPVLQALRVKLERVSGSDMMAQDQARKMRRAAALTAAAAAPSAPARWLRTGWLKASSLLADHGRSILILSLFSFKFLDWWYTSAEPELQRSKRLPPPPPPPPPCVAPGGVSLPLDSRLCPLCRRPRVNPALLTVSGFAFCYPCIFRHVAQHQRCPITHAPAREDHIRSLYEDS